VAYGRPSCPIPTGCTSSWFKLRPRALSRPS